MLPRNNRVSRKEFPVYPTRGFRVSSPLFTAAIYPREHGVGISVVVSKKTAKTAVLRNRIRRRLYATVAPFLKTFVHGSIIVFYPNINAGQVPIDILKNEVSEMLKKQKLIPQGGDL